MKRLVYRPLEEENLADIEAMAVVNPQLCKKLGIKVAVVQGGEGPIPHLHVYLGGTSNCAYIRLDAPEYSEHHSVPSARLDKNQKAAFLEVMKKVWPKQLRESPDGTARPATGYEAAVDTWVDTYEEGSYAKFTLDINGDPVMPDYSQL